MNPDRTAGETLPPGFSSPWAIFLDAPICWLCTFLMVVCFVGCIFWANRRDRKGRFSPCFPGPVLLALVPIVIGAIDGLWFLGHLIGALELAASSGASSGGEYIVAGFATISELILGLGTFFSSLAIGVLVLMHPKSEIPVPLSKPAPPTSDFQSSPPKIV